MSGTHWTFETRSERILSVSAFKLHLPALANGLRSRLGAALPVSAEASKSLPPLPPILALEGTPDPSLRSVIRQVARLLGASICPIESLAALRADPDFDSVVAVVLARPRSPLELHRAVLEARALPGDRPLAVFAPQPLSKTFAGVLPADPAIIAPPISVDRLLTALGLTPAPTS